MGWFSGIADAGEAAAKDAGRIGGDIKPIEKLGVPTIPEVPGAKPIEPIEAPKASGGGTGVAVAGIGLAGAGFILPSILNSSAVTGAISGATQVGTVAVLASDAKDVLNGLVSSVTSSPENMLIFGAGTVLVVYLLLR